MLARSPDKVDDNLTSWVETFIQRWKPSSTIFLARRKAPLSLRRFVIVENECFCYFDFWKVTVVKGGVKDEEAIKELVTGNNADNNDDDNYDSDRYDQERMWLSPSLEWSTDMCGLLNQGLNRFIIITAIVGTIIIKTIFLHRLCNWFSDHGRDGIFRQHWKTRLPFCHGGQRLLVK